MYTPVFIFGKREGQHVKAADVTGPNPSRLFYVTDRNSGIQFLIDTGAQVSVIPPSPKERHSPSALTLQALNNTSICTYGSRSLTLNLGLRRTFRWVFVVADVTHAILGIDFLQHYSLMVDLRQRRLVDAVTSLHVQGIISALTSPSPALLPRDTSNPFTRIVSEFPAVTQPNITTKIVKHGVTHHLTTTGPA